MAKKIAFLTLHGMGTTKRDHYEGLRDALKSDVGADIWNKDVHFDHIFYQDILQQPQNEYFKRISKKIDSKKLAQQSDTLNDAIRVSELSDKNKLMLQKFSLTLVQDDARQPPSDSSGNGNPPSTAFGSPSPPFPSSRL